MSRARELAPGHRSQDTSARPGRRANHPVLALQQAVGNRAVGQLLARKGPKLPNIKIGKHTIEVAGGNIAEWAASKVPEALEVTSVKGKHSAELEKLSKERTRIESLTLTVAAASTNKSGQELDVPTLAIEFTKGRIKDYAVDGKTESWQVVGFEGVHRTKTTRKVS